MWVTSVTLRNIRGVEGPLTVDLIDVAIDGSAAQSAGTPPPVIIYGANGSGKSSICDALEFGLRGASSRRSVGGEKERRELQNLIYGSKTSPPSVTVTFGEGPPILRGGHLGDGTPVSRGTIAGFEHCPVVVRRSAIEGFWQVSSEQRLDFFWDYLPSPSGAWRTPGDEAAIAQHAEALKLLTDIEDRIRESMLPADQTLPGTTYPFNFPRHKAALKVLTRAVLDAKRRSGAKTRLTPGEEELLKAYGEQLSIESPLRQAAGVAEGKSVRRYEDLADILAQAAARSPRCRAPTPTSPPRGATATAPPAHDQLRAAGPADRAKADDHGSRWPMQRRVWQYGRRTG